MTDKWTKYTTYFGMILLLFLTIYSFQQGYFTDQTKLQQLLSNSGFMAPIIFIMIQIIQVIIPIIPGGVSSAIGVLVFGSVNGFIYNYIGLVIGSICIFLLARRYGKPLIMKLASKKAYDKYIKWIDDQKRFDNLFALAIFLPCAPDDLLCMIAGITEISLFKFTMIIILGKPLALIAYSFGLAKILTFLGGILC